MTNYMEPIIESDFVHKGFRCVVLFTVMGHRCGYVEIPHTHPLYNKALDNETLLTDCVDQPVIVHGGITYSRNYLEPIKPKEESSTTWWFGFDCAHPWDKLDIDSYTNYYGESKGYTSDMVESLLRFKDDCSTIKTQEFVEEECKGLAEQLFDIMKNTKEINP